MEKQHDNAGYRDFGDLLHFSLLHLKHKQKRKNNFIFAWHFVTIKVVFSFLDETATDTYLLKAYKFNNENVVCL